MGLYIFIGYLVLIYSFLKKVSPHHILIPIFHAPSCIYPFSIPIEPPISPHLTTSFHLSIPPSPTSLTIFLSTPPIYHSFPTRLAPFPTCMTSKAHGHLLSLYILIPITLHITIPITLKMPHQLPHYSFLTHACMVVLTSLTPTVFYPFIKFTHYLSNHHLPMPTNPLLPLPINCIPFLRDPFVHL